MVILYHDKLPEMWNMSNHSAIHLSRSFKWYIEIYWWVCLYISHWVSVLCLVLSL